MNVYLKKVGCAIFFGLLCVMNVSAMQGEGQSASQSGNSERCLSESSLLGRLIRRCMVPENRTGVSRPVCFGADWLGRGQNYCRPSQRGEGEESVANKVVAGEQLLDARVKQEPVVVAVQQATVPGVKEQLQQFRDSPAVNKLPDDHILKIDMSKLDQISYDERPISKVRAGMDWLQWHSGPHDGNALIEKWSERCNEDTQSQQQQFDTEVRRAGSTQAAVYFPSLWSALKNSERERECAALCFYAMQRLGRKMSCAEGDSLMRSFNPDASNYRSGEYDMGNGACLSWRALHAQVEMGLRLVESQERVELDAAVEVCRKREPIVSKIKEYQYSYRDKTKMIALNRVDGRLAYALSDFLKREKICQYAAQPGYVVDMQEPLAPPAESSAIVNFLAGYRNNRYDETLGNDACSGVGRLSKMLANGEQSAVVNHVHFGIAQCDERGQWLRDLKHSEGQEKREAEGKLLVADAALVYLSSDVFSQWQDSQGWRSLLKMQRPVRGVETLQALRNRVPASFIAYDSQLGDELCKGSSDNRCVMRRRVLDSAEGQKAVAEKHPELLRTLRNIDAEIARDAYKEVRNGERDVYTQSKLRGFCLHK